MTHSTTRKSAHKPAKPYPDFPLFPHATGRWAKKIRGKFHYFGHWEDPQGALQRYLERRDDLHAGRTPRLAKDGVTVRDLANHFLTSKKHLLDSREITARTFAAYRVTCELVIKAFGLRRLVEDLTADDFQRLRKQLSQTRGPVALGNEIQRVRIVFKYGYDAALIDKPTRFGPTFKRPSKRFSAKHGKKKGPACSRRTSSTR